MKRKILQRYVLWELASPTILGLIVFTFILLSNALFRLIDLLVNRGVPLPLFGMLVGTLLPPLLILTMPMALLVGVLLGVGRLSADNEIMAMRTSGVHLMRVFRPIIIAGAVVTLVLYSANSQVVPRLVRLNETLLDQIKFIVASHLEAGEVFNPESDREVALYFGERDLLTRRMRNITLKVEVSENRRAGEPTYVFVSASEGYIEPDPFAGFMDVILTSGTLHYVDRSTTVTGYRNIVTKFGELRWRMDLDSGDPPKPGDEPEAMTNMEISDVLSTGTLASSKVGALKAELHQRRSIPLACIAFVLLGVPLAIHVRPTGKAVAFSIAFGLIFFYYVMLKWGASLSQDGSAIGAGIIFLPNLIIGGAGILLFYKIMRQ